MTPGNPISGQSDRTGAKGRQSVVFVGVARKPIEVRFDQPAQSSDGGALLLRAVDERMNLCTRLATAVADPRDLSRVTHPFAELFRQRVLSIACGYPDGNDAARLAGDPVFKLVCGQDPTDDERLASQPTLSRFENAMTRPQLLRTAYALSAAVLDAQREARRGQGVRVITLDLDGTEDRTYGEQQLSFFNAFYDSWCLLPLITTVQFGEEHEPYVVAPVLRPGNAGNALGALGVLKRLVPQVLARFPHAKLRVRMDGGFANPAVLDWIEERGLEYLVNLPKNSVLARKSERWMKPARRLARQQRSTQKIFAEIHYRAGSWKRSRRVIVKAEVTVLEGREPRDNPRFLVTNSRRRPAKVYASYAARGDMENRIKELKDGLAFDRTSCTRFAANQFRNLLTAAALALYQNLRWLARKGEHARAQVGRLREQLIKVAVTVRETARLFVLQAPEACPSSRAWMQLAVACGALDG